MNESKVEAYETVLQTILRWPLDKRFSLIQDIISALRSDIESSRPKKKTLSRALGLLATDQPTPSDEEIQHWLEEHRLEKYS